MSLLEIIGVVLVLFGSLFMAAAIVASYKTKKEVPAGLTGKWLTLSLLMISFLLGYVTYMIVQVYNIQFPLGFFVSIIFMAGGIFVYLVINLSKSTITEINSKARELAQINANLDVLVQQRTSELQTAMEQLQEEVKAREETEKKIAKAHLELDLIFNTVSEGMRVIDKDFVIVKANKAMGDLIRLPVEKMINEKCYNVFPGKSCNTPNCPMTRIINGEKRVESEVEKTHPDGTGFVCIVTAMPHNDLDGNLLGIIETFKDISPRKIMEEELVASLAKSHELTDQLEKNQEELHEKNLQVEKALMDLKQAQSQILQQEKMASVGQLAAGVAHEINNPMGFIGSNLSTLEKYVEKLHEFIDVQESTLKKFITVPEVLEQVGETRKALKIDFVLEDIMDLVGESLDGADRVKEIVSNLKSFSRVDQAEQADIDINECILSTLNITKNELKYKCTVTNELADLPPVRCYPQQLNQVFTNLLLNASQAIEEKGEIVVKTWSEEGFVCASISDTGSGISEDNLKKIFEPFFTTKDVGKGTGLGLSIVYDIITKNHKGDIRAESTLGKGTTFTIRIPITH